jgi:hypothetical protein
LVDDDVLGLRRRETLILDSEPNRLRSGQVFREGCLALASFFLSILTDLYSLLLGFGLGLLNPLIDITQEEHIEHVIPLPLLSGLFCLIGIGLHSLLDLAQILLPLYLLVLKRIPIYQVPPEALPIMEVVALLEGDIITTNLILLYVPQGVSLGRIHIKIDNLEW